MARSKILIALFVLLIFVISVAYTMVTPSIQGMRKPTVARVMRLKTLKFNRPNPKFVGLREPVDMIELEADLQDLAVDLIDLHDSTVNHMECSHGSE